MYSLFRIKATNEIICNAHILQRAFREWAAGRSVSTKSVCSVEEGECLECITPREYGEHDLVGLSTDEYTEQFVHLEKCYELPFYGKF